MPSSSANVVIMATLVGLAIYAGSLPVGPIAPVGNAELSNMFDANNTTFNCTGDVCRACVDFELFKKQWNLCADLGYEKAKEDYLFEFELNNKVLYKQEVPSFASDPRLCTPLPFIFKLIMTCVDFSGYYVDNNGTAHTCAFFTGTGFFDGKLDFNYTMGCFALPHAGKGVVQLH